jgi:hypothetical protein
MPTFGGEAADTSPQMLSQAVAVRSVAIGAQNQSSAMGIR